MEIRYKNYIIVPDRGQSWTLCEEVQRTNKTTKETYLDIVDVGYYGKIEKAIKDIVYLELEKKKEVVSLSDFVEAQQKLWDEITAYVTPLVKTSL